MAHRITGRKLGRATDHRLAMFRNLVTDLLKYEKIITTEAKAKAEPAAKGDGGDEEMPEWKRKLLELTDGEGEG